MTGPGDFPLVRNAANTVTLDARTGEPLVIQRLAREAGSRARHRWSGTGTVVVLGSWVALTLTIIAGYKRAALKLEPRRSKVMTDSDNTGAEGW